VNAEAKASRYANEVIDAQVWQAMKVLGDIAHGLRERGYDATLHGEGHDGYLTCEIRVRVPGIGIPVEAFAPAALDQYPRLDGDAAGDRDAEMRQSLPVKHVNSACANGTHDRCPATAYIGRTDEDQPLNVPCDCECHTERQS